MITINLLPPEEKEILTFERLRRHFLFFGKVFFCCLFVFIILIFSLYLYFSIVVEAQKNLIEVMSKTSESKRIQEIEEKIKEINHQIVKVQNIQKDSVLWSEILKELTILVPSNVSLNNFYGTKANNQITVQGFAKSREDLLNFEQSLKKSERFFDVYSPISNFLEKTDINFNLTFKFK